MKHGSVAQIHTRACPRDEDGSFAPHRCKGSWRYTLEHGRDSTARRMQTSRAGYPTKSAAQQALQEVVRTLLVDVGVHSVTVGEYLDTWLTGKHALKPKTIALYQDMANTTSSPTSVTSSFSSSGPHTSTACTRRSPWASVVSR